MIRLDSITKTFGDTVIFENASMHIKPNNRIGLIGPNGVGKTTLFRIILGHEGISDGNVFKRGGIALGYVAQEVEKLSGDSILSETLSVFPDLFATEIKLHTLTKQAETDSSEKLLNTIGSLQEKYEKMGGYNIETRAKTILCGLGFKEEKLTENMETLSGGWKMRVALAKVLLQNPDILLLDEPTNHLDLESLIWLEKFLTNYNGSMMIISHDRFFLDRLVTHIAEISRKEIVTYTGTYSSYESMKTERMDLLSRQAKNQEKKIAQTERFIERFRAKNTLATRVKSKIKQLEKIDRVEKPDERVKSMKFTFPQPRRSGLKVFELKHIRKAYGDLVVYDDLNYTVERGDRIALVGPNGAGKSTMMKLMAGVLDANSGEALLGHNVDRTYYAQHQQDALDLDRTVLQNIEGLSPVDSVTSVRSFLGAFLFSGDEVNKKVGILSGGEKARLALARMLINPVNLLLLDEPTNHLDIQSQDVLIESLKQYTGTIICISHDRRFINEICTKVVDVDEGILTEYAGNYDYYTWKMEDRADQSNEPEEKEISANKLSYEQRKVRLKAERKHERRVKQCEAAIAETEKGITKLQEKIEAPANAQNFTLLQELMDEQDALKKKLEENYSAWLEAQEAPIEYEN